ncbi:LysR family transcriptional regulator [Henriciella mobilis]|uniref:LysR family transcriptional regulator n=1 Tax=Henriciella mobilis TaxID=2305467 RepID=UPI000E664A79|nr:LysR family transcriptional regulator [Henriciella mobilis]RIJ16860.1 LysR family transcriptional regulator [Henriciella mobilis]RIJ19359.1 LysR family transcriptional regulator [Henriciella mobilis]
MIDRYLVRYFLAVVDQGTFSRAARETNVAQPTLSVGIAKLESLLGETLFERSTRRISLTSAGARFLPHARRIESEFNQAAVSVRSEGTPEVFRLGILSTIPAGLVGQAFGEVLSAHPEMRVEIVEGSEKELTNALARRRVDTALTIVGRGGERNVEERLYTEPYHVAMMADHPCASQIAVTVEDLAGSIMMVRRHCEALSETSRFFTEQGVRPFFSFRSSNDERVLAMVASGLGITVMPASYDAPGVALRPLEGFTLERSIGLIFRNEEGAKSLPEPIEAGFRSLVDLSPVRA